MIPILFNYNATNFASHGIGDLMECLRCESIVNSDGEYELELEYPAGGQYINQLVNNNIIVAKVNDHGSNQAFRIYSVEKAINNLVTVHAQHLSYDLARLPVKAYEAITCSAAVAGLKTNAVGDMANPYTFYTNVTASAQNQKGKFKIEEPVALRSALLDGEDSIKGTFGGDLIFDNYSVQLLAVGGADRGMLVEYGIDMMDMDLEETIAEMITAVYPYWTGREEGSTEDKIVYGNVQYAAGTFQRQHITTLNVAEYFPNNTTAPSVSEINAKAVEWMNAEEIGQPKFNLKLSYAQIGKDVRLYDAVTVHFQKIGIDVKAKVVSYRYDTLKERCTEIEVGNVKPSILFDLEDASRLKRGLIPPERIQNNSITESKLGNSSVGSSAVKPSTVSGWHIVDEAVSTDKLGKWAVTEDKLGPLSVSSAKIQNGAVGNQQLGEASVTHNKIGQGEIYTANLGDASITTVKIKDGNITEAKIGEGAVVTGKLANGAVTNVKVQDLAITEAKIGNSAITSLKIKDAAVEASKIKDGAVIEAKVGEAAITTQKVKDLAIDSAKIGNSAITSVKILDGAVVEGKVGNQAISFDKVKDANIDQLKLNDFSITSTKIADGDWAYNYATGQWEVRNPAVGTYALQDSAVVTAKIGDYNVAEIKLVQTAQDAIAKVWEVDRIVANRISGTQINCSGIVLGGTLYATRTINYLNHSEIAASMRVLGEQY